MKQRFSRYYFILSILTFLTFFFFIVQSSYDKLMTPIQAVKQNPIIKPVDPQIDLDTLELIETHRTFSP